MCNEIELEILDLLKEGWTDEQIVGSLLRNYQIETAEARSALDAVLIQWLQTYPASPF